MINQGNLCRFNNIARKPENNNVNDISKHELIKLIMDNLHKTYSESESMLATESDPIKACPKLLLDDTETFKDFLTHHENKEISLRTDNNFDQIHKSTLGKQYNIIMDYLCLHIIYIFIY